MVALTASLLLTVYLIVPSFIFRLLFSLFVPLRTFVRTRTEEFYRAIVTAAIPLMLAYTLVWTVPQLKVHPFSFQDSFESRRSDYKVIASALYDEEMFRAYGPEFWHSLTRSSRRQGRLLVWYYSLVVVEAIGFGLLVLNYGKFKHNRIYSKVADRLLLPNISEWFVLLTPLVFPDRKATVKVDILSSDDILYRGAVSQYFLDRDGMLSGLILTDPQRFDRRTYLQEKDKGANKVPETYWKKIPGIPVAKLYIFASKISTLNLNYEPEKPSTQAVTQLVEEKTGKPSTTFTIAITFGKPGDQPQAPGPPPQSKDN